ncbi:MAG: SpoIID/LytB domain-containing protein [Lachnospiraceae bacterium]|nr:SpoIID/LytB domain-containing protein [Lachnospiraceae bacterium]
MKDKRRRLNKSQRMQLKAFICVLGILLLFILFVWRSISTLLHRSSENMPEERTPVVREAANVWIMGADSSGITVFEDGERKSYIYDDEYAAELDCGDMGELLRDRLADIELADDKVTDIYIKTDKINGKLLSAASDGIEFEELGIIPLADDYKGYRTYGSPEMCTLDDLAYGYNFADFIVEDGKICGFFIAREEAMEDIRVLIKTSDYSGIYHASLVLTCNADFFASAGSGGEGLTQSFRAGEEFVIDSESELFEYGRVTIWSDNVLNDEIVLKNVTRSQGTPSYRGKIELICEEDGIVVINELPLEEYLYSVVPSEMPSAYPEEALRAQAICARTYAYAHMQHAAYPEYGAHVDDSTTYQVYNNIVEKESSTLAVKESYGQLLYTQAGELAGAYYYSTSCGIGTDANIWKTEEAPTLTYLKPKSISPEGFADMVSAYNGDSDGQAYGLGTLLQDNEAFDEFILSVNPDDYEASEGWYRWKYTVGTLDAEYMCEVLKRRRSANSELILKMDGSGEFSEGEVKSFDTVEDIYIAKRGAGGVCDELVIVTNAGTYKVITEHNIRYVLDDGNSEVVRQDNSSVEMPTLLPSAFFSLSVVRENGNVVGYTLTGGGFGHGVGMSQNGAKNMAAAGLSAEDILSFFFEGCTVGAVY